MSRDGGAGIRQWIGRASGIALGALAAVALTVVAPLAVGLRPIVVSSDSMQPALNRGDLVYIRPSAVNTEVEVGDIAVVRTDDGLLTHRVVRVAAGGSFETRGDANPTPDTGVHAERDLVGAVRLVVPRVGTVTLTPFLGIAIGLSTMLLIALVTPRSRRERPKLA